MPEQWFYAVGNETRGPLEREALVRLIQEGTLQTNSLVWRDGLAGWTAAGEVPGLLSDAPSGPPPVPGSRGVLMDEVEQARRAAAPPAA
jgi:hypothetical protein